MKRTFYIPEHQEQIMFDEIATQQFVRRKMQTY